MFPALKNTIENLTVAYKKSFTEILLDDYRFEANLNTRLHGTRSVFYYKAEHSLVISHIYTNRVHILNLTTGKLRWFDHHGTTVRSVQVCDHEIVSGSWDGTVCFTNFDSLELRLTLTEKEMGRCPDVAISPNHSFAYSYSYDSDKNPKRKSNTVRRWSIANGELKKVFKLPGVHRTGRRCGACAVHGNRLYAVSDSGHLHIYHTSIPILISERSFNDELQTICIVPAFNMLVIAGGEGNLYLCSLSGKRIKQITRAHNHDVSQLLIHPKKPEILISVSFDGTMKIWKLPDLELLESIDVKRIYLWTVAVVNDLLVVGGEADDVWIYDMKNLPGVILKGRLVISNDSYAYLPSDSSSFYASDLSMMQVRNSDYSSILDSQYAAYLLNAASNFKIFKDLFSSESPETHESLNESKGYYQLTQ